MASLLLLLLMLLLGHAPTTSAGPFSGGWVGGMDRMPRRGPGIVTHTRPPPNPTTPGRVAVGPASVHRHQQQQQRRRRSSPLAFLNDGAAGGQHEGAKLGRSGVWARLHNATEALMDKLEDAIEDEKKAISDFIARVFFLKSAFSVATNACCMYLARWPCTRVCGQVLSHTRARPSFPLPCLDRK